MTCRLVTCLTAALAATAVAGLCRAQKGGIAAGLTVNPPRQTVDLGSKAEFTVGLRDSKGAPLKTFKPIQVRLEALLPSGQVRKIEVLLPAGQADAMASLAMEETGVVIIRARSNETREGGATVNVRRPAKAPRPRRSVRPPCFRPPGPGPLPLKLTIIPGDGILANGSDAGRVLVVVADAGRARKADLHLVFETTLGQLNPARVVLRKSEDLAEMEIKSNRPGDGEVRLLSASAPVSIAALRVRFRPPIDGFQYFPPGPATITLIEKKEIGITLTSNSSDCVKTDEEVKFYLASDRNGQVVPDTVTVPAGECKATPAKFTPSARGEVRIHARTAGMVHGGDFRLNVGFPWSSMLSMVGGGLVGGLLIYLLPKHRSWWRHAAIGSICGFVAYWAVLFGIESLVPALLKGLDAGRALNPLSAFGIGLIGGAIGPWWLPQDQDKDQGPPEEKSLEAHA